MELKQDVNLNKVQVLYDNIIVLPLRGHEKVGNLILPDNAENKPQLGKVIACGEGRVLDNGEVIPMPAKKGQVLLFNKYSATTFAIKDVEYLVIRVEDIIAIL